MTPDNALLWLAGLEKEGVPVLDLRELCPCPPYCVAYLDSPDDQDWRRCGPCSRSNAEGKMGVHGPWCNHCQGRGWVPKEGLDSLHSAMKEAGWSLRLYQDSSDVRPYLGRRVYFTCTINERFIQGSDIDDHLAAVKALKLAGY